MNFNFELPRKTVKDDFKEPFTDHVEWLDKKQDDSELPEANSSKEIDIIGKQVFYNNCIKYAKDIHKFAMDYELKDGSVFIWRKCYVDNDSYYWTMRSELNLYISSFERNLKHYRRTLDNI